MINIIENILEKTIVKKYGPIGYRVRSTDDFPSHLGLKGYVVSLYNLDQKLIRKVSNDVKMILRMLGFKDVVVYDGDRTTYVIGADPKMIKK